MKNSSKGFAIIEVMIILAIVGILAWLAISIFSRLASRPGPGEPVVSEHLQVGRVYQVLRRFADEEGNYAIIRQVSDRIHSPVFYKFKEALHEHTACFVVITGDKEKIFRPIDCTPEISALIK